MKIFIIKYSIRLSYTRRVLMFMLFVLIASVGKAQINHIRTYDAVAPEQTPAALIVKGVRDVKTTTQYFDGLGRPLQIVVKQGSLETATNTFADMVSHVVYDQFGREPIKYLPFAANNAGGNTAIANGAYKTNALAQQAAFLTLQYPGESFFYSKINFEPSPLNRPLNTYAPGSAWAGSEANTNTALQRNVQKNYAINTALDNVKVWKVNNATTVGSFGTYALDLSVNNGIYPQGELYKNITIDEHKKQVIEFKDKNEKVVLKKVQLTATGDNGSGSDHPGWLCTYYIYDDLGNLRCVLQPKAVAHLPANGWALAPDVLDELAFRYEYDSRNRMVVKKVPGAAPVYMVYDSRDRLILIQDGKMAQSYLTSDENIHARWLYTEYDALNRPCRTSLVTLTDALTYQYATGPVLLAKHFAATTVSPAPSGFSAYFSAHGLSDQGENSLEDGGPYTLTETYYDNYNWAAGMDAGFVNFLGSEVAYNANDFQAPSNSGYPYPQAITPSTATKGLVTGTMTAVLAPYYYSHQKLYSLVHYDDRGRAIQTKTQNHLGGMDIATTQYSFSGQVLMAKNRHYTSTTAATPFVTDTRYSYDDLGRMQKTEKRIAQGAVTTATPSAPYKVVNSMEYDAAGQLKTKKLGRQPGGTATLANLTFDYNIRGWLLGINRGFLQDNNTTPDQWFGFELGYDRAVIVAGRDFTGQQYNGNIGGTVWRSKGDMAKRKYDYGYDAANRLLSGTFEQRNADLQWNNAEMDFTTKMGDGVNPNSAYDDNGNILAMTHLGWKPGAATAAARTIDNLGYTYFANSNKLRAVTDNGTAGNKLGDFEDGHAVTNPADPGFADYGYDVNGNLVTDLNKGIKSYDWADNTGLGIGIGEGAIRYNHLNLPVSIFVRDAANNNVKGVINYTYDAAGNKLEKSVRDYTNNTTTVTHYIGGMVYESRQGGPAAQNYANRLQFTGHEEGRVRAVYGNTAQPNTLTGFVFDYMLKDHLGNVRSVVTEEQRVDVYPAATLEPALAATEGSYYTIDPTKIVANAAANGLKDLIDNPQTYPNNNLPIATNNNTSCTGNLCTTALSEKVYKLNGNANKTGLGMVLKVMAGDKLDVFGKSYYHQSAGGVGNSAIPILDLLNGFIGVSGGGVGGVHGQVTAGQINTPAGTAGIVDMFTEQGNQSGTNVNKPKAFLNIVFFDEQLKAAGFKVSMVGDNKELKNHYQELQNLAVPKNGFVYIYCSNESPVDVFFDNVQVVHTRGALLEETHYYPFGLTMAGISSKAAGMVENKAKFNGIEQNKDFDLNMYDARYRNLDPQIGRFWQIDPRPGYAESPYAAMGNNPIRFSDFLGDTAVDKNGKNVLITRNEDGTLSYTFDASYSAKQKAKVEKAFMKGAGKVLNSLNNSKVGQKIVDRIANISTKVTIDPTNYNSFNRTLLKNANSGLKKGDVMANGEYDKVNIQPYLNLYDAKKGATFDEWLGAVMTVEVGHIEKDQIAEEAKGYSQDPKSPDFQRVYTPLLNMATRFMIQYRDEKGMPIISYNFAPVVGYELKLDADNQKRKDEMKPQPE